MSFDDNKDNDKKPKRMSSRLTQEHFMNQEKFDFKIQESREDSIKISTKKFLPLLSF